jgi:hypothetical protein
MILSKGRFAVFLTTTFISMTAICAPNLMLFPVRVVFDKNKRAHQIDLTNTGDEPGTYRITLENKRMTEEGKFIPADKLIAGELPADKIIQFSPRQVVLAPGAGQTIRLVLRKPADLAVGEYRSHLVFSRIPDITSTSPAKNALKKNEVGITLTAMIGASIPVIVENGATTATAHLTHLKLIKATAKETARVDFHIEREGNRSLYGDLTVYWVAKGGTEKEVAASKGISIYSPYPSRNASISLQNENKLSLTNGKLIVRYNETRDAGGQLLAEASVEIP